MFGLADRGNKNQGEPGVGNWTNMVVIERSYKPMKN